MNRLAVYAMAAALACSTPMPPVARAASMCVDGAFTAYEHREIRAASNVWREHARIELRVVDGAMPPTDCEHTIYRVESHYSWVALRSMDTVAFVDAIGGRSAWIVIDRVPQCALRHVAAHEIGHLLGYEHGSGVMAPSIGAPHEPD